MFWIFCILPLTFQQLAELPADDLNNREIEIRGFLYTKEEGGFILSSEPDLKTCCIEAPNKASSQITIIFREKPIPNNRAVTVQGVLHTYIEKDNWKLMDAVVIPQNANNLLLVFLILGLLCVAFFIIRALA
jgi:hypothetical protein